MTDKEIIKKLTNSKRILLSISVLLGLWFLVTIYMFLTNPSEVELPWKNLAINIIPNLVASIIGFLVALVIYRRIDKEIEQEELVNKIKEQMPQPVTVTPAPDLSKMEKNGICALTQHLDYMISMGGMHKKEE